MITDLFERINMAYIACLSAESDGQMVEARFEYDTALDALERAVDGRIPLITSDMVH